MKIVISKQLRDLAKESKKYIPATFIILGVVALIGLITWALWPKTLFARVDSIGWYYSVELHEKTIAHGSEWGSPWGKEVVSGSLSCISKYYGMKDCMCHTDYDYTGYGKNRHRTSHRVCSRCPDYRDWCNYDYVTWPVKNKWDSSGDSFAVSWPDYPQPNENQRVVRSEYYNVVFLDAEDNKKYTLHPKSLNEFREFVVGERHKIKVFVNNSIDIIDGQ